MSAIARIPRGVWALGFVSLCMDLSSELIHALLPLYMAVGLGASTLTIGIVEGAAIAEFVRDQPGRRSQKCINDPQFVGPQR